MTQKLLTLILVLALAATARAIPARPTLLNYRQPDGTTIAVRLMGDETFHYYLTSDGFPLMPDADGTLCYATANGNLLHPTAIAAHDMGQRTQAERQFIAANSTLPQALPLIHQARLNQRNALRHSMAKARRMPAQPRLGEAHTPYEGQKKGLVILVNFADKQMTPAATREHFEAKVNETGYSGQGIGSVHDYFLAQSYGKFDLTFDVVGPVNLSRTMEYYGTNNTSGSDARAGSMVVEACQLADSEVDFSDYDWDGDGEVDQVFIIYAGYAESAGAPSSTIWPHEYWLQWSDYGDVLTLDGVTINTYACSSELKGTEGDNIDGIGPMCHEFSHCLGLPDLYDTNGMVNFGMNTWSIMALGAYNGDSDIPCAYTAYERMYAGWLAPQELTEPCQVEGMRPITEAPDAYIIYNEANRDEYYLLENRQLHSWDRGGYGHGMLVVHVDYDSDIWNYNWVNADFSHQRCTIIPADNSFFTLGYVTLAELEGDPYPGSKRNHSLTDRSKPAATLYNANTDGRKLMGKPIEQIEESADGLISFTFMGGDDPEAINAAQARADEAVEVYSTDGRLLLRSTSSMWRKALPKGIYLLRSAGTTRAVSTLN